MNTKRPVNLDLMTITLPVTAVASILHRITAVISWFAFTLLIILLWVGLSTPEMYANISQFFASNPIGQFLTWGFLTAFGYYCAASAKHIIQDLGFCEDLKGGRCISWAAIAVGVVLSIISFVVVWF